MYKGWTENELKSSKSPKTLVQDLQKITCSGCMGEKKCNVEVLPAFTLWIKT